MDKKSLSLAFDLRFQKIQEINPSFDLAKIAVAYHGKNRNYSIIKKEVFEAAKESLFNIPVVGRFTGDDFGGHDITIAETNDGLKIEVATVPFGVVHESAKVEWEMIEEESGEEREYLTTECLIWKRSIGYDKLVEGEKWNQSMEITVNDFEFDDNEYLVIKDMTFNALCILGTGVEPCFESASIQFSLDSDGNGLSKDFTAMLQDFKELSVEMSDDDPKKKKDKKGKRSSNPTSDPDPDYDPPTVTEEEEEEEGGGEGEGEGEGGDPEKPEGGEPEGGDPENPEGGEPEGDDPENPEGGESGGDDPDPVSGDSSKNGEEMRDAITRAIETHSYSDDTGEHTYYAMSFDDNYAYAEVYSCTGENLSTKYVRFNYLQSGDSIDLTDETDIYANWSNEYDLGELVSELESLREFKNERIFSDHKEKVDKYVSENFSDVIETEEFEALGSSIYEVEQEELSEKLYAIRGKHAKYSPKPTLAPKEGIKIPIKGNKEESTNSRYGSLFTTYGKK